MLNLAKYSMVSVEFNLCTCEIVYSYRPSTILWLHNSALLG